MVIPLGPSAIDQVTGWVPENNVGVVPVYGSPSIVESSDIGLIIGASPLDVTINCQLSSSEPDAFVARIVMVCGLPATVGFGQDTNPVLELIVMPTGLFTNDHVTGNVPSDNVGVGPV